MRVRSEVLLLAQLLTRPSAAFEELATNGKHAALRMLAIVGILSALPALTWALGAAGSPRTVLPAPFAAVFLTTYLMGIAWVIVLALAIWMLLPMYGRRRQAMGALVVAGASSCPALSAGVFLFKPVLAAFVILIVPYCAYLVCFGAQRMLGVAKSDSAEFAAAAIVLSSAGGVALGAGLTAMGWI